MNILIFGAGAIGCHIAYCLRSRENSIFCKDTIEPLKVELDNIKNQLKLIINSFKLILLSIKICNSLNLLKKN